MERWNSFAHLLVVFLPAASGQSLGDALSAHREALGLVRNALAHTGLDSSLDYAQNDSTIFVPTDAAVRQFLTNWGLTEAFLTDNSKLHSVTCLLKYLTLPEGPLRKNSLTEQLPYYGFYESGHRAAAVDTLCDSACFVGPSCWKHLILHADKHGEGSLLAGGGVVVSADVSWRNGMAHVVDAVPNAVFWAPTGARSLHSLVYSRSDLGILWRACQGVGLDSELERKAEYGYKYTMFAPTDAAIRQYLSSWQMTEDEFVAGGDSYRPTDALLRSLLFRGFGDESDLWRAAAARAGSAQLESMCPCGGTVAIEAVGDARTRHLKVGGGSIIARDQMWLGGPVHVIDIVPHAPCWSGWSPQATQAPSAVATTPAPLPTTRAAAPSFGCSESVDSLLKKAMGDRVSLIREVLQENGLADRMETWRTPVTVFAPTDKALRKFMNKYRLTEDDLLVQGYMADNCVNKLFKHLIHETQLPTADMKQWVHGHGAFELPTLCQACSEGLWVSEENDRVLINGGGIAMADLSWCNGLLHIIEEMPVPLDWAPGTSSCKASTHTSVAEEEGPSDSTMLATSWTPQPRPDTPQITLPNDWPIEHVALMVFAAMVMFVGCSSMIFAYVVHRRKSEKVLPQADWDVEVLKPPKTIHGIPVDDLKKPHVKGLDLENALPVRESWELGSQASTRLPSSRSMSTVSSARTQSSSNSRLSRSSSHSALSSSSPLALALPPAPIPPSLRNTAGAVARDEPPFAEFGRKATAPRRSSSERRGQTGEKKASGSRRSRSERRSSSDRARQPTLSAVQEEERSRRR